MAGEDAKAIMWLALALFLAVGGVGLGYALWRLGRTLRGAERDLHRTVDGIVPLLVKASESIDQVNDQLGKVDVMMDSAVDMTEALDTTVRAVSVAVSEPVKKVSGVVAGMSEGVASFRTRMSEEVETVPFPDMAAEQGSED